MRENTEILLRLWQIELVEEKLFLSSGKMWYKTKSMNGKRFTLSHNMCVLLSCWEFDWWFVIFAILRGEKENYRQSEMCHLLPYEKLTVGGSIREKYRKVAERLMTIVGSSLLLGHRPTAFASFDYARCCVSGCREHEETKYCIPISIAGIRAMSHYPQFFINFSLSSAFHFISSE